MLSIMLKVKKINMFPGRHIDSSIDDAETFEAVNLLCKVFFFKGSREALMWSTSVGSESCGCKRADKQSRKVRDLCLCTTKRRKKKRSVSSRTYNVISDQKMILQTSYHCFKVHLLLHQSFRDFGRLLEVHIIYKTETKIFNACVQWRYKDLTWRFPLLLAHVRHSPSAVPCTRRYFTEWKFLALSVTVEFCTQFAFTLTEKGLSDRKDERLRCSCETYEVVGVLRRLHHVALCVDGICNKEPRNHIHSTLDLGTLVWNWWKLP